MNKNLVFLFCLFCIFPCLVLSIDTTGLSESIDAYILTDQQHNVVFRELKCLQKSLKTNNIRTKVADRNITILAPFLKEAFENQKPNAFGPKERALFYSQMMIETRFLNDFVETKKFNNDGGQGEHSPGSVGIENIIKVAETDVHYSKAKPGARHSRDMGKYRGRGLIQNTRCDNYIATIHYLNLKYRGKKPVWKADWYATENSKATKSEQIDTVCTDAQIERLKKGYKKRFGMELDLFSLLTDPMKFTIPGMSLSDPGINRTFPGEKIMVDAAMAFWRGRCDRDQKHIYQFIRRPMASKSVYCPRNKSGLTENQIISLCATKCVKGSTGSWQVRHAVFEKALACRGE